MGMGKEVAVIILMILMKYAAGDPAETIRYVFYWILLYLISLFFAVVQSLNSIHCGHQASETHL